MSLPPDPAGLRWLLTVDDELIQRLIVRRVGLAAGFEVVDAATVAEARQVLAELEIDLVVLDLSLGSEDGIELLRELPRLGKAAPKVIFVSGFDDRVRLSASRLADGLGLAVLGTLKKPLMPETLRAMLGAVPKHRRDRPEMPGELIGPDDLARALDCGEIVAMFQPKLSLKSGTVIGVEALARWTSPRFGSVPPDRFIPLAEQAGLAHRLTTTILRQSLAACAGWRVAHPLVTVAVNLSPSLLTDLSLPEEIEAALAEAAVPPGSLVLEVTESQAIGDTNLAADVLTRIRIRGVQLSIDDFGTGHSSLLSLLRLPFGELKIDKSFIAGLADDPEALKITRVILVLGKELGMRVVAEGIETEAAETMLREAGCDVVQGWRYARAMSGPALLAWLAAAA